MERADVVVVGGGVMGSAAARSLARRGLDTILLERFPFGHSRGSSHGPTRIFRIAYPDPMYSRMARRALGLWRELEADAGEHVLVPTGGLDAGPEAHLVGQALEMVGERFEWLSADEAGERFPAISFDGLHPILFQPDAAVALADRTVAAQLRTASEAGADLRDEVQVAAFDPSDDRVVVRTGSGDDVEARVAVVAAGSWAGRLLEHVTGSPVPLTPILQTISYFAPRAPDGPRIPTFIEWGSPELVWYALDPAGEAPGVKVGAHVGGIAVDPDQGPFPAREDLVRTQSDYVSRRLPGVDPVAARADTCLYTMTPDEDFVLDRVGQVVIGAGFSGHGFKFGPLVGELLAALALGEDPGMDLDRFRLGRPALAVSG